MTPKRKKKPKMFPLKFRDSTSHAHSTDILQWRAQMLKGPKGHDSKSIWKASD